MGYSILFYLFFFFDIKLFQNYASNIDEPKYFRYQKDLFVTHEVLCSFFFKEVLLCATSFSSNCEIT